MIRPNTILVLLSTAFALSSCQNKAADSTADNKNPNSRTVITVNSAPTDSSDVLNTARLHMTKGNGVEQNYEESVRLLNLAAEQGYADAINRLESILPKE